MLGLPQTFPEGRTSYGLLFPNDIFIQHIMGFMLNLDIVGVSLFNYLFYSADNISSFLAS